MVFLFSTFPIIFATIRDFMIIVIILLVIFSFQALISAVFPVFLVFPSTFALLSPWAFQDVPNLSSTSLFPSLLIFLAFLFLSVLSSISLDFPFLLIPFFSSIPFVSKHFLFE